MITGIDISAIQSNIDWNGVVNSGFKFVVAKCGNGNDGFDGMYEKHIQDANNVGLLCATYHVIYPLPNDPAHPGRSPQEQANAHAARCKTAIVAADLEFPAPQDFGKWNVSATFIENWVNEYMDIYSKLLGGNILLYTYPYFMKALNNPQSFAKHNLWLA